MKEKRFLLFISIFIVFPFACENQGERTEEKGKYKMEPAPNYIEKERFDPEISIDSLIQIEQELDEKLEDFGIKKDSLPVDSVEMIDEHKSNL